MITSETLDRKIDWESGDSLPYIEDDIESNILNCWKEDANKFRRGIKKALDLYLILLSLYLYKVFPEPNLSLFVLVILFTISLIVLLKMFRFFLFGRHGSLGTGRAYNFFIEYHKQPLGMDHFSKELWVLLKKILVLALFIGSYLLLCFWLIGFFWKGENAFGRLRNVFENWDSVINQFWSYGGYYDANHQNHLHAIIFYFAYLLILCVSKLAYFYIAPFAIPLRLSRYILKRENNVVINRVQAYRNIYWYIFTKSLIRNHFVQILFGTIITFILPIFPLATNMKLSNLGAQLTFYTFWSSGMTLLFGPLLFSYIFINKVFEEYCYTALASYYINGLENHVIVSPFSSIQMKIITDLFGRYMKGQYRNPECFGIIINKMGELKVLCIRFLLIMENLEKFAELFDSASGTGIVAIKRKLKDEMGHSHTVYVPAIKGRIEDKSTLVKAGYQDAILLISMNSERESSIELKKSILEISSSLKRDNFAAAITPVVMAVNDLNEYNYLIPQIVDRNIYVVSPNLIYGSSMAKQLLPQITTSWNNDYQGLGEIHNHLLILLGDGEMIYHTLDALWTQMEAYASENTILEWFSKYVYVLSDDKHILDEYDKEKQCWNFLIRRCVSDPYKPKIVSVQTLMHCPHNLESIHNLLGMISHQSNEGKIEPSSITFAILSLNSQVNQRITAELCMSLDMLNITKPTRVRCNFNIVTMDEIEQDMIESLVKLNSERIAQTSFAIDPIVKLGELYANLVYNKCSAIIDAQCWEVRY